MTHERNIQHGFTLIELLVVIAIIGLLVSILLPSISRAKDLAEASSCLSNLHALGTATGLYHHDNDGYFWPYMLPNRPTPGVKCYFWGTDADPVDPSASPFMNYCSNSLEYLWCPSFKWGTYIPQGWYVSEPTTTYAYNGRYLDPNLNGTETRSVNSIPRPSELFVFNDSAMRWQVNGEMIFQNSTYMEPVEGMWVQQPTTHFRHSGKNHSLCADGHAGKFGPEGWNLDTSHKLGFVGTKNDPHYEQ